MSPSFGTANVSHGLPKTLMSPLLKYLAIIAFNLLVACIQIFKVKIRVQAPFNFDSISPYTAYDQKDCEVLVLNHKYNFHYEVLESILALYPLPQRSSCNLTRTYFTFAIADGNERENWSNLSVSWYEYAKQQMMTHEYTGIEGQSRYVDEVFRNSTHVNTDGFDYQIQASCYCDDVNVTTWLFEDETHFCVFHNISDESRTYPRTMWLNPHIQPSFFPSILPHFHHPQILNNNGSTRHICGIGDVKRRSYGLVAEFLHKHKDISGLHFHHFGKGNVPGPMKPYTEYFTMHYIQNFTQYQIELSHSCDVILSLLTRSKNPEYFMGPTKLSGGIVQAAAYQIPILLHEDLAAGYGKHLHFMETHGDNYTSFSLGFERLLENLKKANYSQLASRTN